MAADTGAPSRSWFRLTLAAVTAAASLGVTVLFVSQTAAEHGVATSSVHALVMGAEAKMLAPSLEVEARHALWLNPLNQDALNVIYASAVRRGDNPDRLSYLRTTLAKLGWRSTSTQQNLLVAAIQREDFLEVMDRVDGLLRRSKFVTQVDPFIAAVENDPRTRSVLVNKLNANPPWRELLLVRGGELHDRPRLVARTATMNAMLDRGATLSRVEVAPFLAAAAVAGETMSAHQLWSRTLRQRTPGGLLYDGDFKVAAVQGVRPPLPVPFEWKFENGDGYTTQVGSGGGLFLRWSGRGVPLLLSQPIKVPVKSRGYRLHVETDAPSIAIVAGKLAFALSCGNRTAEFHPIGRTVRSIDLATGSVACDTPLFTLTGRLQNVAEPITATIIELHLRSS